MLAQTEGIFTETAGGTTIAVTKKLIAQGYIPSDESLVICITGNGLKTIDAVLGKIGETIPIAPSLASLEEALAERAHTLPAKSVPIGEPLVGAA